MERYHRKTPLDVLKSTWVAIRESAGEEIEHTKLVKYLQKLFPSCADLIETYISNAVVDGLIQVVDKPKKPRPKSVYHYTLPNIENFSFPVEHPDFYCYECHLEGIVVKCLGCLRVFHRDCVRTSVEKQLELERFTTKYKRVNISAFGFSDGLNKDNSLPLANHIENSVSPVPSVETNRSCSPPNDIDQCVVLVKNELKEENCKEQKFNGALLADDAQFVGVIRPPDRRLERRLNTPTVKPEDNGYNIMDREELMSKYCYPCREMHGNMYSTPPNMSKKELNYLLKFVIEQYKSWLPEDTYSPTGRARVSEITDNMELCHKLLIRSPITVNLIQSKVDTEKYVTLEEFSADIQDIAHNMAIIHGSNSLEYCAAMYFVTDCVYDLYEIRQCSDCFRHSNEKKTPDWFARPCVTRHELVFAKQKGYQYWPAKVIRVYNNKYDVRFFGDKHPRAVIDASNVKPIDTDFDTLKVNPKQRGFQKAVDELHKHQTLIDLPKEYFAFGSNDSCNLVLPNVQKHQQIATTIQKRGRKPNNVSINISSDNSLNTTRNSQSPVAKQNTSSPEVRPTRQKEKRNSDVINNENTLLLQKKTRTHQDVAPLNETSPHTTTTSPSHNEKRQGASGSANNSATQPRSPRIKAQLKRQYSDDVLKLKALMDEMNDIDKIKQLAVNALQEDINRWQQKIRDLVAEYNNRISLVKRKQWCKSCENESILHCCWNTSYCSRSCQEKDWPTHKKLHKFVK